MNRLWALGFVVMMLGAGCSGGETTTNPAQDGVVACEPLASVSVALELGQVLGAGKSSDGTLYVVDQTEQGQRVFVSDGDELVLQTVSGSGETVDGDGTLTSLWLDDPERHVALWQGRDGTTRMAVLQGELPADAKAFEIGLAGESWSW